VKEWKKRLKEGKIKGKILKRILTVRRPVSNQFHIQAISSVSSHGISKGEGGESR